MNPDGTLVDGAEGGKAGREERISPRRLSYSSTPEERNDRERVFKACVRDGGQLRYASAALRSDREFILSVLSSASLIRSQRIWELLQHAEGDELRNDRDLVWAAVDNNFLALQFASARLRADPELVLLAMTEDPFALNWAGPSLKSDLDFITAASSMTHAF